MARNRFRARARAGPARNARAAVVPKSTVPADSEPACVFGPEIIYKPYAWSQPAIIVAIGVALTMFFLFAFVERLAPKPPHPYVHSHGFKIKSSVYNSAFKLTTLQQSLETRMAEHNDIINGGIANFTSIFVNLTEEADTFGGHLELVKNLVDLGKEKLDGDSFQSWGEVVQLLADADETIKTDAASGADKAKMLELMNDTADTMAAEMKDMEAFMKEANAAVAALLQALESYPNPHEAGKVEGLKDEDSDLQWSWDEITADGTVVRSVGVFNEIQKEMMTAYFNSGEFLHSSVLTYGLGAPDTFISPHNTPYHNNHNTVQIRRSDSLFLPNPGQNHYHCDIVISYDEVTVFKGYWWLSVFLEADLQRRLVSVESLRCGPPGKGVDVVRRY